MRFGVDQAGCYLCGYLKPRLNLWFPIHWEFAFYTTKVILQPIDFAFIRRSPFRNSLSGCESNRVVKEWRLLTRESESSKGLLPGCEPNLHGCSRTLRATGSELKLAPRVSNRPKPAKTGLEMQKAESGHSRLSVLTG
jgi:hypothetical protein